MKNKSQQVRAAKKSGAKKAKRAKVLANRKKNPGEQMMTLMTPRGRVRVKMSDLVKKDPNKKQKVAKPKKQLKPYRVTLIQNKIERLQAGIRELDHSDPKRMKMVEKLTALKNKLN